jgi:RHS repeat-associated protein
MILYIYLYDALGSTIAITNMNAGIIDNNRFAPYGEALSPVAKNSRLTNSPWGYTGESHDIEAGLVYLRARYYEPGTARFIQQESYPYFGEVQKPLTRNLYIYGNANPMIFTDPSGHYSVKQEKIAHEQFQNYFKKLYGKSQVFKAFKDFPIYQPFLPRTMNKKADLVLSKRGTVEVYEIEAYNKSGSGRKSLNSNVKGLKDNRIHVIKGTTYKRQGKKLVLSYPGNSKKQIEYYTKPYDPGMIYYKIISKEGTGNANVYAQATTDKNRLSSEKQKANAEYIYNYLSEKGWYKEAICGLLGNINQESWFNPGVWQDLNNTSLGYGIVQWDDATKFLNWAGLKFDGANEMAKNDPKHLMDLELDILIWSMQPGRGEWLPSLSANYGSPYKMTYEEFITSTKNAGDLALVFHGSYERSSDDAKRK